MKPHYRLDFMSVLQFKQRIKSQGVPVLTLVLNLILTSFSKGYYHHLKGRNYFMRNMDVVLFPWIGYLGTISYLKPTG